jgi:DNA polymerase-3 subunit beta
MSAEVSIRGEALIPLRKVVDLVKTYPQASVSISCDENGVTNFICENSDVSIVGYTAEDYPKQEIYNLDDFIVVSNDTLKSMIKETAFSCAKSDQGGILTGMLLKYTLDNLTTVALNGYVLALRSETISSRYSFEYVVPQRSMTEVLRILSIFPEEATIQLIKNKFIVNIGRTKIISNLLKGDYLNYQGLIPENITTIVKLNIKDLYNSVERAALMSEEGSSGIPSIRLSFTKSLLVVSSRSASGQVTEEINIQKNGEDLKISFNTNYFLDVLRNIPDERAIFECASNTEAALFKPIDSDKFLYMIMPVRDLPENE